MQQPAFADVWGFIDDKGVAHFAAERTDARYELFFKGGESFDTNQGLAGKTVGPVSQTQAAANSKIQAYYDVSPHFKQVKHVMQTYRALKPPAAIVELRNASMPSRVRMEMGAATGGAVGRGNMISPAIAAPSIKPSMGPITSLGLPAISLGDAPGTQLY